MFVFAPPSVPQGQTVTVTRYWISARGNPLSATEIYGPSGLVSAPARITGVEVSETEYVGARRGKLAEREAMQAQVELEDREYASSQRDLAAENEERRNAALEALAEATGIDVSVLEGL